MESDSLQALRDQGTAARFYDQRFQTGYMDDWSKEKRARVGGLIRQLGLPPTGRALDFGCGMGVFTEVLQDALPGWTIDGTDLSAVAVQAASRRLPGCNFFLFDECANRAGQYDLVFTHHVLEHVSDLEQTAGLIARISKPAASMFHIMPCGNAGSFEHGLCLLRSDGIRAEPERLFFFEEEGHLRRLDTDKIVALWSRDGYRLTQDWYDNHRIGAMRARTSFGLRDVLQYADPSQAVDERARRALRRIRLKLVVLWAARKPLAVIGVKRRFGCHNARDYALLTAALAVYPVAKLVDWNLNRREAEEWRTRSRDRAASEMFIHLTRP